MTSVLVFVLRNGVVAAGYLDAEEEKLADKLLKGIKTTKSKTYCG